MTGSDFFGVFDAGADTDRLLQYVGLAWLLLGACVSLPILWRCARPFVEFVRAFGVRAVLTKAFGRAVPNPNENYMAMRVAQELEARKLENTRYLLPAAHLCGQVTVLVMLFGGTLPTSFCQRLVVVFQSLCFTLVFVFPWLLTSKTVDWWFSVVMVAMSIHVSPIAVVADSVIEYSVGACVFGFATCIFNHKMSLNILLMAFMNCVACVTVLAGDRANPSAVSPLTECSQLTTVSLIALLLVSSIDRLLLKAVRCELEADMSRGELAVAQSVLRSACDAVLELDDELRLAAHSEDLRDLLLLNHQRSLEQEDMISFLASDEDGAKFAESMRGGEESTQTVTEFQVCMKDSAGISLPVEIFGVLFRNRKGRRAYLVGIREHPDASQREIRRRRVARGFDRKRPGPLSNMYRGSQEAKTAATTQAEEVPRSIVIGRQSLDPASLCQVQEVEQANASDASDLSTTSSEAASDAQEVEMAVRVDLLSDAWSVMGVTEGLRAFMGVGDEDMKGILRWIRGTDRESLIGFAQSAIHEADGNPMLATYDVPVFMSTEHMRRHKMWVHPILEFHIEAPSVNPLDSRSTIQARIVLRGDMCWKQLPGYRRKASRVGRGAGTPSSHVHRGLIAGIEIDGGSDLTSQSKETVQL